MIRGLDRLPEHMRDSVEMWIRQGQPHPRLLGSFMRSVLLNDLMGAYANADQENTAAMRAWVMFLYNDAPGGCYGSEERLQAWHDRGGLEGPR